MGKFLKFSIVTLVIFLLFKLKIIACVATHYCTKPYKFNPQTEVDTYICDLEIYQKCMADQEAVNEYKQVMNSL